MRDAADAWESYVRGQFAKCVGPMCKYISKQDKRFCNVDIQSMGGSNNSPTVFLKQQSSQWAKMWAPNPASDEHAEVAVGLAHLRSHAQEEDKCLLQPQQLKHAINIIFGDTRP